MHESKLLFAWTISWLREKHIKATDMVTTIILFYRWKKQDMRWTFFLYGNKKLGKSSLILNPMLIVD